MGDYADADDELIAELVDVIDGMVANDELELASRRDNTTIANRLFAELRRDAGVAIADWLVEQEVVVELYLDGDEVASRFAPVLARLGGDEPTPRWNEELAARIEEAPDDAAARVVFGDWLQEAGDPRGELVQIQARRAASPSDAALAQREQTFLRRYHSYLLGPLAEHEGVRATWRYGFIDELEAVLPAFLEARAHPSLRFLRRLVVSGRDGLDALVGKVPPRLVALEVSGAMGGASPALDELVGDLALEELASRFVNALVDLDKLRLPRLRSLYLGAWAVIGRDPSGWRAAFPALERLSLQCDVAYSDADLEPALAVLARPPARLTALHLTGGVVGPWVRRLVESPLLTQLVELDLSGARLDDLTHLLERHRAQLAHLARLDLRDTHPPEAVRALANLHPHVLLGSRLPAPPTFPHESYDEGDDDDDEAPDDDEALLEPDDERDREGDDDDDGAPPEVRFDDD
ncbi:MAG: TIGR02996 domain-containing protein [Deltaproteobacteria bacterium]|nr:TIGR02996 domain-containing protein [Deltaproteobacteria bacterium]